MNIASRKILSFRFTNPMKSTNGEGLFGRKAINKKRMSLVACAAPLFIETKSECPLTTIHNNVEKLSSTLQEFLQGVTALCSPPAATKPITKVKSYKEIPKPRSLPFLGSVLDYTPLGDFTPMEFDKALVQRHKT